MINSTFSKTQSVSIIVLCYYDGHSLPILIEELQNCLKSIALVSEIIIVDDGSKDDSYSVAEQLSVKYKNVSAFKHETNYGVGATFYTGARQAKHEWVGYIDGDGQYSIYDFKKMLLALEDSDAISGLRIKRADPYYRTIISSIYNFIISKIFGLKMKDINSGIKCFRRSSLISVFPIISQGPFFDAEVLIKMKFQNRQIKEIPVSHFVRLNGYPRGASAKNIIATFNEITKKDFDRFIRDNMAAKFYINCLKVILFFLKN